MINFESRNIIVKLVNLRIEDYPLKQLSKKTGKIKVSLRNAWDCNKRLGHWSHRRKREG
jgi:hypothetical protein